MVNIKKSKKEQQQKTYQLSKLFLWTEKPSVIFIYISNEEKIVLQVNTLLHCSIT